MSNVLSFDQLMREKNAALINKIIIENKDSSADFKEIVSVTNADANKYKPSYLNWLLNDLENDLRNDVDAEVQNG